MATDSPESDLSRTGERNVPQIAGESEAGDAKLAEFREVAREGEEQLRTELSRQAAHFGESIYRLQRELQVQATQSAECIRELKAEIEHLKITRFHAKRENYSIKTSLSWRLTWPLRVLADAGTALVHRLQVRFRLPSGRRLSSSNLAEDAHSVAGLPPRIEARPGHDEPPSEVDQQTIDGFMEGLSNLDRKKEAVLLVTHESSRTGAPILALNLARAFRQKYNVIVLALREGALGYEFVTASDLVVGPLSAEQRSPHFLTALVRELAVRAPLKFAIVNSIVSTTTLSALWENDIAIVHLIHEFSSYIRPCGQFRTSAFYSGERIFSSEILRENARQELPEQALPGRVLPQGMCLPPLKPEPRERERIRFDLRPAGWPADTVIVLGAGTVTFRKGVDLFIACAKRVAEMAPAKKFRFAWFGEGMDSGLDAKYSLYLADQIQRSGLNEVAVILKAASDMEGAYLESDILFLSSRLDPLPSVCLEAIHYARPVVCFESATGIAEYLAPDPLASFGIVPFLDVESAAHRIFRLIEDGDFRFQVGQASKALTKSQFLFERYAAELDGIARECALKKQQERADRLVISQSNLFNAAFYCCPKSSRDPIRHYISAYSSGIRPRKAVPGFHPGIYQERNGIQGRDPLAHYLDNGQPSGPWRFDVIREASEEQVAERSLRIGLHLHLHYHEMGGEIFEHLRGINSRIDLLISVTSQPAAEAVQHVFSCYSQGAVDIQVFDNRGRDIGPFLSGFGKAILDRYDIIGHVHAKKSAGRTADAGSPTPEFLESIARWRRFLYANLLGGERAMADAIIRRFSIDDTVGLAFPDDPYLLGWGKNLPYALDLAQRLGIAESLPKTTFNFPVGSMFWARTAALRPLLELGLTWGDYPREPVPYDGSLLHAIERILPFVAESAGFRSLVTYTGITR